jgi:hypothetical protein
MDKIIQRGKLHKAKTFNGNSQSLTSGLDLMVRESMYLVWPATGMSQDHIKGRNWRGRGSGCFFSVDSAPDEWSDSDEDER